MSRALLIAYYRVSTARQGRSGLGLAAQRRVVLAYARSVKARIVASYQEAESARHRNAKRPQLAAAIEHAKRIGATLVIAKLDRLARNVAFTSAIMESKVEFLACDNPHATRLTIHILAAVAEEEGRLISERTRAALAEARRRGKRLGWWAQRRNRRKRARPAAKRKVMTPARRAAAIRARNIKVSAANQRKAQAFAATVRPLVLRLRAKGLSLERIARELNRRGLRTRTGSRWAPANISRVEILGRLVARPRKS